MGDEITIKPNPTAAATTVASENQNNINPWTYPIGICALGLGVSFFLPWASIFGVNISGFDLQKHGDGQLSLWLIPILCAITIFAGATKRSQQIAGQLAGALPYAVGVYWYLKMGNDLFHVLTFGAFLSLIFGAVLFALAGKSK